MAAEAVSYALTAYQMAKARKKKKKTKEEEEKDIQEEEVVVERLKSEPAEVTCSFCGEVVVTKTRRVYDKSTYFACAGLAIFG